MIIMQGMSYLAWIVLAVKTTIMWGIIAVVINLIFTGQKCLEC